MGVAGEVGTTMTPMSERGGQPRYPVESVGNALIAADLLRSKPSLRVAELADRLGVARSTAHRLMASLVSHGFAETDDAGQGYVAGAGFLRLGALALDRLVIRQVAHSSLVTLARTTGETCELALLDGVDVLLVDVVEGSHTLRVVDPVGSRAPAHLTAAGKAMLAALPEVEVEQLYDQDLLETRTKRSIGTRAELLEQLSRVRQMGYAEARTELGEDYVGVAAPVVGADGMVVGGITVALPVVRAAEDFASAIGPKVVAAAGEVASRLEGRHR